MSSFFTVDAATSTTPTKYVDAVDFSRKVNIRAQGSGIYVGFSSSDVNFKIPEGGTSTEASDSPAVDVILPAGQELWAKSSSGAPSIYLFVGGSPD